MAFRELSLSTASGENEGKSHVDCAHYVKLTCISTNDDITITLSLKIYFLLYGERSPWSL